MPAPVPDPDQALASAASQAADGYTGFGKLLDWLTNVWQRFIRWIAGPFIWHLQDRTKHWWVKQFPNAVSTLRIPLSVWCAINLARASAGARGAWWLLAVFLLLSDGFDGALARGLHVESDYGKAVDPIADKVFFASMGLALVAHLDFYPVSVLMVLLLVIEGLVFIVGTLVGIKAHRLDEPPPGSSIWGKNKFVVECLTILLGWAIPHQATAQWLTFIGLLIAAPLALSSLYDYWLKYRGLGQPPQH